MSESENHIDRRKALGALAAIGTGSVAVGAGTFAGFSETESSAGHELTTDVLNLAIGQSETLQFATADIQPGDTGVSKVSLTNSGGVSGTLDINIASVTDSEGTTPDSETNNVALSEALDLKLFLEPDGGGGGTADQYDPSYDQGLEPDGTVASGGESYSYADANEYPTGTDSSSAWDLGTLGSVHDFVVRWRLPSDGGDVDINGVMDDTITIDFQFTLTQA